MLNLYHFFYFLFSYFTSTTTFSIQSNQMTSYKSRTFSRYSQTLSHKCKIRHTLNNSVTPHNTYYWKNGKNTSQNYWKNGK
nr:MAG TPA: hypothetical protein [Caudoviricetes sp.]